MGIAALRRTHWIAVGICCGALLGYLYGEPGAPSARGRVGVDAFEADLLSPALPDGHPVISDIVIYPPHEGIHLVTFRSPAGDDAGNALTRHYLYAKTPFASDSPPNETIVTYLQRIAPGNPQVRYSYAWWKEPLWRMLFSAAGFGLLIGGVWPVLLRWLVGAGYGPIKAEPAYDLGRFGKGKTAADARQPRPSEADSAQLEQLDAAILRQLREKEATEGVSSIAPQQAPGPAPAPAKLDGGPLQPPEAQIKEEKEYRGEFYPTARGTPKQKPKGFSLVELLVVIGIIGLLLALLLPTLGKVRETANTIACAANLRSIGQGMAIYLAENRQTYPAAYLYEGHSIADGEQTPRSPSEGYIHWSSYLYGSGKTPTAAFRCPSMSRGGLPPTNTTDDNLDPGQNNQVAGVVDKQAPRNSYTVNEAICPRNKFVLGFQGAARTYHFVKAGQIANASGTILGTEWIDSGKLISRDTGTSGWIMSHRPLHGFVGSDGTLDLYQLPPDSGFRRTTPQDLDPDPATEAQTLTMLDWVGRNHGAKRSYPDRRKSNFLYVDGHVVSKSIYETLVPFEWGERFYSLDPSNDLTMP